MDPITEGEPLPLQLFRRGMPFSCDAAMHSPPTVRRWRRAAPGRAAAGFTLVEVLAAMIILAVGLLALEGLAGGAARTTAASGRRSRYVEAAVDTLERTLGRLREGRPAGGGSYALRNPAGEVAARVYLTVEGGPPLAPPSPPRRRWDVTVRVIPADPARLADSVSLVGSVVQ